MATKPGAQKFEILEQIVEDTEVSGLTFQFEKRNSGEFAIYVYGDLPYGHRTLVFDADGNFAGAGTHLKTCPCPTWISEAASVTHRCSAAVD